jgi:hypothetical protein
MNISRNKEGRPGSTGSEFSRRVRARGTPRTYLPMAAQHPIESIETATGAAHGDEAALHLWAAPPAHDRAG